MDRAVQLSLAQQRHGRLQIVARFPGLEHEIETLAIAIDGEVRPDAAYETLMPLSEIYFVPKIAGGGGGIR